MNKGCKGGEEEEEVKKLMCRGGDEHEADGGKLANINRPLPSSLSNRYEENPVAPPRSKKVASGSQSSKNSDRTDISVENGKCQQQPTGNNIIGEIGDSGSSVDKQKKQSLESNIQPVVDA